MVLKSGTIPQTHSDAGGFTSCLYFTAQAMGMGEFSQDTPPSDEGAYGTLGETVGHWDMI